MGTQQRAKLQGKQPGAELETEGWTDSPACAWTPTTQDTGNWLSLGRILGVRVRNALAGKRSVFT